MARNKVDHLFAVCVGASSDTLLYPIKTITSVRTKNGFDALKPTVLNTIDASLAWLRGSLDHPKNEFEHSYWLVPDGTSFLTMRQDIIVKVHLESDNHPIREEWFRFRIIRGDTVDTESIDLA